MTDTPLRGFEPATEQLCEDGVVRSGCVMHHDYQHGDLKGSLCNKPMVGIIEFLPGWKIRICQEDLDMIVESKKHGL